MENANIKAVCWSMENGNMNTWRPSQECNGNEKGESDSQRDLKATQKKAEPVSKATQSPVSEIAMSMQV